MKAARWVRPRSSRTTCASRPTCARPTARAPSAPQASAEVADAVLSRGRDLAGPGVRRAGLAPVGLRADPGLLAAPPSGCSTSACSSGPSPTACGGALLVLLGIARRRRGAGLP
ncbi:MAG: hypothetical protein MZV64_28020 [Ignavibacteriales bacterium]|nr:hypothetical protein [Ignavibacteriales bacterium]